MRRFAVALMVVLLLVGSMPSSSNAETKVPTENLIRAVGEKIGFSINKEGIKAVIATISKDKGSRANAVIEAGITAKDGVYFGINTADFADLALGVNQAVKDLEIKPNYITTCEQNYGLDLVGKWFYHVVFKDSTGKVTQEKLYVFSDWQPRAGYFNENFSLFNDNKNNALYYSTYIWDGVKWGNESSSNYIVENNLVFVITKAQLGYGSHYVAGTGSNCEYTLKSLPVRGPETQTIIDTINNYYGNYDNSVHNFRYDYDMNDYETEPLNPPFTPEEVEEMFNPPTVVDPPRVPDVPDGTGDVSTDVKSITSLMADTYNGLKTFMADSVDMMKSLTQGTAGLVSFLGTFFSWLPNQFVSVVTVGFMIGMVGYWFRR